MHNSWKEKPPEKKIERMLAENDTFSPGPVRKFTGTGKEGGEVDVFTKETKRAAVEERAMTEQKVKNINAGVRPC